MYYPGVRGESIRRALRVSQRLDAFVPPDKPLGSEDAARARVAAGISFLMCLVFTILAVAHLIARHYGEAAVNGGLATVTLLAPFVMRRRGRYLLVLNATLALCVVAMIMIAVKQRGPGINAATVALCEIPLFATLLAGIRVGTIWVFISCLASSLVGVVAPVQPTRSFDRLNDHAVLVIVTGTLFLVAVLYERGRAHQLKQFAELDARRHAAELEGVRSRSDARVEQAESLASLGRVAAAVAHELNNPLAYVLGNLEFLAEQLDTSAFPPDLRAPVAEAIDGAVRMKHIVADLSQFTRPSAAEAKPGDIVDAVTTALKMAESHLRAKATVHNTITTMPPVRAGTPRLTQVFLNLVVNAAQAMPEGHAADNRIELRALVQNERVVVEIEDNGAGLPPDVIQQATNELFSAKPTGQGLGLGLALTHTIVEAAGGKLEFESRPGHTVARVLLPVAVTPVAAAPAAPVAEVAPVATQRYPAPNSDSAPAPAVDTPLSVLIVDDEVSVAQALARVLRGQKVSIVAGGREALRLIGSGMRFDVVLCDVMMPDLSGIDVYEAVERDHPEWLERFIFMTGGTFTSRAKDFQERVPNPFLSKPIQAATLRAAVQQRRAKAR